MRQPLPYITTVATCLLFLIAKPSFAQSPTIASVTPLSGPVGTVVIITGTDFSATATDNTVYFGATKAAVSAATPTLLTVTVPVGATYRPVSVTVDTLTAYSELPFSTTFTGGSDTLSFEATFAAPVIYNTPLDNFYIVLSDLDGDGKADIIVSNTENGSIDSNTISVFRNTSSPQTIAFAKKINFNTGGDPRAIVAADFDGDGKQDIAVYNQVNSTVSVFRNISTKGNINFAPKADFSVDGGSGDGIAVGDVDGDGKPDIVTSGQKISVLRNTTTGGIISFDTKVSILTPGNVSVGLAMADFDGDGRPDITAANNTDTSISVFRNLSTPGTIAFDTAKTYKAGKFPYGVCTADVDGDGKLDIIVANEVAGSISIFRNTSVEDTISFAAQDVYSGLEDPVLVTAGDLTGDGKPDIFTGNLQTNTGAFFRNTSAAGLVSFATDLSDPGRLVRVTGSAIGDIDGDGKPDLVVGFGTNSFTIAIYRNKSGITLPLTMLNFSGTLTGKNVQLQWQTTNEVNTSLFNVERSGDGINFSTIGSVPAAGNSTGVRSYTFTDAGIPLSTVFYRLKMVDVNGNFTYSNVIIFKIGGNDNGLSFYPNPAKTYILAKYPAGKGQLTVVDMNGRVIKKITLPGNTTESNISVQGLAPGTYSIVWSGGKLIKSSLLIVQ